jgi:hypothetical protein
MLTQEDLWAETGLSQFVTGWGPRTDAVAGEVAATDAIPTAAVAMATIAVIRRLLFIANPPVTGYANRRGLAANKEDTKGESSLSAAFIGVLCLYRAFCTKCVGVLNRKDDVEQRSLLITRSGLIRGNRRRKIRFKAPETSRYGTMTA